MIGSIQSLLALAVLMIHTTAQMNRPSQYETCGHVPVLDGEVDGCYHKKADEQLLEVVQLSVHQYGPSCQLPFLQVEMSPMLGTHTISPSIAVVQAGRSASMPPPQGRPFSITHGG